MTKVSASTSASAASVSVSAPAYFAIFCSSTGISAWFPLLLPLLLLLFQFQPQLTLHLPQSRALAAGEQPGRIKVHRSSAEISAWFPLLLQPHLLLLLSIRRWSLTRVRPHREDTSEYGFIAYSEFFFVFLLKKYCTIYPLFTRRLRIQELRIDDMLNSLLLGGSLQRRP